MVVNGQKMLAIQASSPVWNVDKEVATQFRAKGLATKFRRRRGAALHCGGLGLVEGWGNGCWWWSSTSCGSARCCRGAGAQEEEGLGSAEGRGCTAERGERGKVVKEGL